MRTGLTGCVSGPEPWPCDAITLHGRLVPVEVMNQDSVVALASVGTAAHRPARETVAHVGTENLLPLDEFTDEPTES